MKNDEEGFERHKFDPEKFWQAYEEQKEDKDIFNPEVWKDIQDILQEDREDRDFFAQKLKEQEEKNNIVEFPLTIKFQLDIRAIEDRILSISTALDDVIYELKELRRRLNKQ